MLEPVKFTLVIAIRWSQLNTFVFQCRNLVTSCMERQDEAAMAPLGHFERFFLVGGSRPKCKVAIAFTAPVHWTEDHVLLVAAFPSMLGIANKLGLSAAPQVNEGLVLIQW